MVGSSRRRRSGSANSTAASATRIRQPPDSAEHGLALRRLVEAEAGEDGGGPGLGRMGVDIGEPGLNVGDAVRIGRGLGLGEQGGALGIGGEHHLDQALRARRRFLRDLTDAGTSAARRSTPISGAISPVISRKRVVLPAPFWPTRPVLAPSASATVAWSKRSRCPIR